MSHVVLRWFHDSIKTIVKKKGNFFLHEND